MRMTKKQRFIADCCNPYYGKFATKKEVKQAKLLARGKYWIVYLNFGTNQSSEDFNMFCAYSKTGKRRYFEFDWYLPKHSKNFKKKIKSKMRKVCRLWCNCKYKEALKLEEEIINLYYNKVDSITLKKSEYVYLYNKKGKGQLFFIER